MWLAGGEGGIGCHVGNGLNQTTPGIVQEPIGAVKPAKVELRE